jgi:lysozyme
VVYVTRDLLIKQLMQDEGLRLAPYTDTTGNLTIGYGRNLTDRGIRVAEALLMLDNDVNESLTELKRYPWFRALDEVRQAVLVNMHFNLGGTKLAGFKQTLKAIERGDYEAAANGMRKSLWAKQVGKRATRLAQQMQTGEW